MTEQIETKVANEVHEVVGVVCMLLLRVVRVLWCYVPCASSYVLRRLLRNALRKLINS
jgi:hypothetical protein